MFLFPTDTWCQVEVLIQASAQGGLSHILSPSFTKALHEKFWALLLWFLPNNYFINALKDEMLGEARRGHSQGLDCSIMQCCQNPSSLSIPPKANYCFKSVDDHFLCKCEWGVANTMVQKQQIQKPTADFEMYSEMQPVDHAVTQSLLTFLYVTSSFSSLWEPTTYLGLQVSKSGRPECCSLFSEYTVCFQIVKKQKPLTSLCSS